VGLAADDGTKRGIGIDGLMGRVSGPGRGTAHLIVS
jgi:hypothetical protein